ncbi:SusC/RagA family TonB-linked outer membrane protein [Flammeovirga yaeyamensis]|uniref:SusC/RagA family TonB-linked outer membrane protein n=2 Tax=Flammeovirga yaeyamensis TaxID=367791 RepID=A0AAX1MZA5_9BACT|nr:TonB-dependent receptor [Flammeovirga yaeyamensis]MBB3700841.1 iron complex outermembrane receptor protein [Flammeovirga yaeyamensis]NMF37949.1 TonB-dependent receptor [Flammeovirga yaeyamensis]QWG00601.1 SusC/RagA family TonB-linked outer membrane protein [Flammeovirga yaeyamensis]
MSINSTKQFAATMLLLLFSLVAFAQERSVSGTVVDENGDPLPGVAVLVKGTTKGGTTDFDGKFKITLADGEDVLVVSYIGYKAQEISVGTSTNLDVAMEVDAEQLEEVVVIGYGSVKKEDATGSVQAINASDFNQGAITSPQEQLQGKVAGVAITTAGGAPGAGADIRIRGGSSLSASNDPLIVIDGVPVDNDGIQGMQNPLSAINPADIETFTVLKDASATAIYGSRASNGVVLITTKKGSSGKMKIDYTGNVSIATVPKTVDVYNADGFRNLIRTRWGENSKAESFMGNTNTDWQDQIFSSAVSTDHNVSVSGSVKDKLPYRVSVGYTWNDGILNTSHMDRTTGNLSLTPKFFDDHLSVNVNVKGMYIQNRFADTGAIGSAIAMDPSHQPKYDSDEFKPYGGYFTWLDGDGNPITIAPSNPLALLEQKRDESTVKRSIGNMQLDYKFHFLPELRANLNVGYDYSESEGTVKAGTDAAFVGNQAGLDNRYTQSKKNELLDFYLQYNKDLPSIDSKIDVMAGYSWQHFWREEYNRDATAAGFVNNEKLFRTENYLVSFFGRLNYTFKDRYLLTATVRSDGTSRFSPDTRWGVFPSLAAAWNIKKEGFLATNDLVSTLKLRAGYGITGQQNINTNDYPYLPQYTFSQNERAQAEFYVKDGNGNWVPEHLPTLRPEGYDSKIKWEETTTYNLGVDFGFKDDRTTGSIDVYKRTTDDLLNTIPVPAGSNLVDQLLTNVGSLENQGIEIALNHKIINTSDLFWDFGVNVTYATYKITKLTQVEDEDYRGVLTGGIAGGTGNTVQIHSVGHPRQAFYVWEQIYGSDGNPLDGAYVDRNNDGRVTEDDKYQYNNPDPKWMFGFTTKASYKNWDFSMAGRMNLGNYVYNNLASGASLTGTFTDVGYTNNQPTALGSTMFNQPQYFSNHFVENASFFRLDNISVGYNFNNLKNGAVHLRVNATVNNAFVITNYSGLDPEIFGGIDNNVYPRPRTFLLGVNVGF